MIAIGIVLKMVIGIVQMQEWRSTKYNHWNSNNDSNISNSTKDSNWNTSNDSNTMKRVIGIVLQWEEF